jgi:hypothetical protein
MSVTEPKHAAYVLHLMNCFSSHRCDTNFGMFAVVTPLGRSLVARQPRLALANRGLLPVRAFHASKHAVVSSMSMGDISVGGKHRIVSVIKFRYRIFAKGTCGKKGGIRF